MENSDLVKKIKDGIAKSGFPLELEIGSILERKDWVYSIGNIYEDFETGKYRESDISCQKTINGMAIHMFIECKKSTDKQIVLYAQKSNKFSPFLYFWLKIFPRVGVTSNSVKSEGRVYE